MSDAVLTTLIIAVVGPVVLVVLKSMKPKADTITSAFAIYEALVKRTDTENKQLRDDYEKMKSDKNKEIEILNAEINRLKGGV